MASINEKLDKLTQSVDFLTKRLDSFEHKFDRINERIADLETKLDGKCRNIEGTSNRRMDILTEKVATLEKFQPDTEKTALMQESYSKRMNILIHGIEEDSNSVWESHKQTTEKFENFLEDALKMNPDNIEVVDIHRLPQQPIFKKGIKVSKK